MNISMKEWITGVIQNHKTVAVPVMTHPGIELTGKSVREACCDGQTHFEAIKALASRYPTAAATVIMDLTVEVEAFGADVHFTEDAVPAVIGHLLNDADDIKDNDRFLIYVQIQFSPGLQTILKNECRIS